MVTLVSGHEELEAALRRPDAYPHPVAAVSVVETHISILFFAGDRVYKIKKPVDFGFLDFTRPERRRFFCEEEVRLNRRLAPDTYLGVVPILRRPDGSLAVAPVKGEGGESLDLVGEPVEWAVAMKRLPANCMLDHLLDAGEIDNEQMNRLADLLARFHAAARTGTGVDEFGAPEAIAKNTQENFDQTRAVVGEVASGAVISERLHGFLEERARADLARHRAQFEERVRAGRIRDGHGDLHAGNICYLDEDIVVYDCIEFSDRLRCGDVAVDLAFLAMDLDRRGYRGFSSYLCRQYAEASHDPGLLELLPFYKGYRAVVRAKIASFRCQDEAASSAARAQAREEAMGYFHLAASYAMAPSLILTCGLPGTGKSWAAHAAANPFEAIVERSDVRRKLLAQVPLGRAEGTGYGEGIYSQETSDRTYRELLDEAELRLEQGRPVVVDATFASAARRAPFFALAQRLGIPCLLLHVTADEEVVRARMEERSREHRGVSDADFGIYVRARESFEPPAEIPPEQVLEHRSLSRSQGELASLVIDRLLELGASS